MAEGISVLVLEDEFLTSEQIVDTLKDYGYSIAGTAKNVEEALKILEKKPVDIAILDINVSGKMSGIDLAKKINEDYRIPFIYLTAYSQKHIFDAAYLTEPSAYLTKPFNEIDIFASLELAIKNHTATSKSNDKNLLDEDFFLNGDFIFMKDKRTHVKLKVDDILYFRSELKYIDIYTNKRFYSTRCSVNGILDIFKDYSYFTRIHRSYIINVNKIDEIGANFIMINGEKLPIGGLYKKEFFDRLKFLS